MPLIFILINCEKTTEVYSHTHTQSHPKPSEMGAQKYSIFKIRIEIRNNGGGENSKKIKIGRWTPINDNVDGDYENRYYRVIYNRKIIISVSNNGRKIGKIRVSNDEWWV